MSAHKTPERNCMDGQTWTHTDIRHWTTMRMPMLVLMSDDDGWGRSGKSWLQNARRCRGLRGREGGGFYLVLCPLPQMLWGMERQLVEHPTSKTKYGDTQTKMNSSADFKGILAYFQYAIKTTYHEKPYLGCNVKTDHHGYHATALMCREWSYSQWEQGIWCAARQTNVHYITVE